MFELEGAFGHGGLGLTVSVALLEFRSTTRKKINKKIEKRNQIRVSDQNEGNNKNHNKSPFFFFGGKAPFFNISFLPEDLKE